MKNEDIEIIVYRRPNLFSVNNNMFNLMGITELERFFTIPDYKGGGETWVLYYPERFLNIVEQRALIQRLEKSDYKKVQIITNSVFIIQCSKNVKIAELNENLDENQFQLSYTPCGLPDDSGLSVL